MTRDISHLDAIQQRLRVAQRLLNGARNRRESVFYAQQVAMIRREEDNEYAFLGIEPPTLDDVLMSDDELLTALTTP